MTRQSVVTTKHDNSGDYEVEIFDQPGPKRVIVCSHGVGVRRWDGEKFFYAVADHFADSAILLVDQNQPNGDSITLNPLPVLASRVDEIISEAKQLYPEVPIVVMAHSFGCGVATFIDSRDVSAFVLVTPTVGTPYEKYIERYGPDVVNGKSIITSDGLKKDITADYMSSVKGISWEEEYTKLVKSTIPIYVFEAGDDEIIGDERFSIRDLGFMSYDIISGAKHNLSGKALADFFAKVDQLL